jgi:hypothetical protein
LSGQQAASVTRGRFKHLCRAFMLAADRIERAPFSGIYAGSSKRMNRSGSASWAMPPNNSPDRGRR